MLAAIAELLVTFQVIQQRKDGSVDFDRNWNDYKKGFGKLDKDFWLGLLDDLLCLSVAEDFLCLRVCLSSGFKG